MLSSLTDLPAWRCRRKGHDWFPPIERREFLPSTSTCLRCRATHVALPWGQCIGAGRAHEHRIAEHYDANGHLMPHPFCRGPA